MDHVTRVRTWLKEQSYDGVILSRRDNFTLPIQRRREKRSLHQCRSRDRVLCRQRRRGKASGRFQRRAPHGSRAESLGGEVVLVPWYESMDAFIREMADGENVCVRHRHRRDKKCTEPAGRFKTAPGPGRGGTVPGESGQACAQIVEGVCRDAKTRADGRRGWRQT